MSLYDKLRVAILPIDIAQGDIETNKARVLDMLNTLPEEGVDIVVLPELFSTGYISDPQKARQLAEREDGETIRWLIDLSRTHMAAFCGSYLSKTSTMTFNRAFFVEPNGDVSFYDKRHLFCISEESKVCKQGLQLPTVVRYRGWNIALAVCYDLRFPVWLRNTCNKYDILMMPSNWPEKRSHAWSTLLQARAIENECYVVGANRSGADDFGTYDDMSQIYDFMGMPVGEKVGQTVIARLNRSNLQRYREHFPVWRDADDFTVTLF